jgi:hypothetical protein
MRAIHVLGPREMREPETIALWRRIVVETILPQIFDEGDSRFGPAQDART